MTNIFSLVKESSIPNEIFSSKYSKEVYTESSISLFESFNQILTESTMTLYTKIAEAESIKEENDAIKNFISQIQSELNDLSLKLSSTTSRFAISLSNYCDIAKQMIDDNSSIGIDSNISFRAKYLSYVAPRLLDSNVPRMNPYTIFEKEFNLIAQLMQELPISASNKEKLDAIASICDKFNGFMSESIRRNVYMDLIQQGDEGPNPLSSSITSLFRDKEVTERNITIEEYQDAVSCISNCNQYISSISETNNKLIRDLNHIIEDLGELLSGCDRNKFKVNTRQDGIRNTIYSVDIYCSNKIMWLVQEKIRQICDVYDKYFIALSVKMDCILSYVKQSSDIIEAFNYLNTKCRKDKCKTGVPEDNLDIDDGSSELDEPIDGGGEDPDFDDSENMDTTGKEVTEDDTSDGESSEPELDDTSINTEEYDDLENPTPNFEAATYGELEDSLIDFYVDLHESSVGFQQIEILEHVQLLIEDEGAPETVIQFSQYHSKDKKKPLWRRILDRLSRIWSKFKEAFSKTYQEKVEFLKENEVYINIPAFDYAISMPQIYHDRINHVSLPDFDISDFERILLNIAEGKEIDDKYTSEEAFINSIPNLKRFAPKKDSAETLSSNIKDYIIDPENKIDNANKINPQEIYNEYCKKFMEYFTYVKAMTATLEKAQDGANRSAETYAKGTVNAIRKGMQDNPGPSQSVAAQSILTADMYFNEFDSSPGKNEEKNDANKKDTDSKNGDTNKNENDQSTDADKVEKEMQTVLDKAFNVYFGVCSKITSSMMFVIQKVFDEYYAYLTWHIDKAKSEREDKIKEARGEDDKEEKDDSDSKSKDNDTETGSNDKVEFN